jgi:hypothetical protein
MSESPYNAAYFLTSDCRAQIVQARGSQQYHVHEFLRDLYFHRNDECAFDNKRPVTNRHCNMIPEHRI